MLRNGSIRHQYSQSADLTHSLRKPIKKKVLTDQIIMAHWLTKETVVMMKCAAADRKML